MPGKQGMERRLALVGLVVTIGASSAHAKLKPRLRNRHPGQEIAESLMTSLAKRITDWLNAYICGAEDHWGCAGGHLEPSAHMPKGKTQIARLVEQVSLLRSPFDRYITGIISRHHVVQAV
jgi:hypothetical protein